jgi:maleylacetoacetate isomerase
MDSKQEIVLYNFQRSSPSWRVRLALSLKNIDYKYVAVPLNNQKILAQKKVDELKKLNPYGRVPTLFIDGKAISESVAIIEYLDETRPTQKPLLPKCPLMRAKVRQLVEIINSGVQPFQNIPVLAMIDDFKQDRKKWAAFWIRRGLSAFEDIIKDTRGQYCTGD